MALDMISCKLLAAVVVVGVGGAHSESVEFNCSLIPARGPPGVKGSPLLEDLRLSLEHHFQSG